MISNIIMNHNYTHTLIISQLSFVLNNGRLCSEASSFMTGTEIVVDLGHTNATL